MVVGAGSLCVRGCLRRRRRTSRLGVLAGLRNWFGKRLAPGARVLGYNKLCELEDFADDTLRRYMRAIFVREGGRLAPYERAREHRKYWEVAQAARALVDFGAVHAHADILGVAAGVEETIFWVTNHARRVYAIDRYLDAGDWEAEAPRSMLTTPGEHARCDWNERRLVVQHMDARELHYEDATFDGIFCTSSVEHFGDEQDVRQALAEMWRVLKPGGIVTLSTEFRLRGPPPGMPGTLLFDAAELEEIVVRPLPWSPVEPLDLSVSERTLRTVVSLSAVHAGTAPLYPHIVLEDGEFLFTSVQLVLRKDASSETCSQ
jgi:SAM-dependent methyltransferase